MINDLKKMIARARGAKDPEGRERISVSSEDTQAVRHIHDALQEHASQLGHLEAEYQRRKHRILEEMESLRSDAQSHIALLQSKYEATDGDWRLELPEQNDGKGALVRTD